MRPRRRWRDPVSGVIDLDPAARAAVRPGAIVFVMLRDAVASGPARPLAARRLPASSFPLAFEIGQGDVMAGGQIPDEVLVEARLDSDGDPITRAAQRSLRTPGQREDRHAGPAPRPQSRGPRTERRRAMAKASTEARRLPAERGIARGPRRHRDAGGAARHSSCGRSCCWRRAGGPPCAAWPIPAPARASGKAPLATAIHRATGLPGRGLGPGLGPGRDRAAADRARAHGRAAPAGADGCRRCASLPAAAWWRR